MVVGWPLTGAMVRLVLTRGKFTDGFNYLDQIPVISISLDKSWLESFAPKVQLQVPGYHSWGPTTIESLLTRSSIFKNLFPKSVKLIDGIRWEMVERIGLFA